MYKAMDARTYFDQSFVLIVSTSIASHLLRAHNRIRAVQSTRTNFDDDTASTASVTTTFSLSISMEETRSSPPPPSTNDGLLDLSQDTLGERFCSLGGLLSHARQNNREMRPMDALVTAGDSW